ncbi:MAG: ABC-F family ATP-binding cassette domain-containing protein, partial [Fretibacterium sp.]|nr:ABC-F family ATP-binding cassette domain-containing protein [Fretibacterium sp.]
SQESSLNLDYSNTVWQEARSAPSVLNDVGCRSLLGAFLFSGKDIHKAISVLSGGEKARLALFKLMLAETNFLILDEPTNHLDMATKELVQNALLAYGGTLLIVSHDRHFLDVLAERVLEIRGGRLYDYPGNYSWFLEKREEHMKAEEASEVPSQGREGRGREDRRAEAAERQRLLAETRPLKKELASLEADIDAGETRTQEIDRDLCSPEVLADSELIQLLMKERAELEKTLMEDYARWEELSLRLEELEA